MSIINLLVYYQKNSQMSQKPDSKSTILVVNIIKTVISNNFFLFYVIFSHFFSFF